MFLLLTIFCSHLILNVVFETLTTGRFDHIIQIEQGWANGRLHVHIVDLEKREYNLIFLLHFPWPRRHSFVIIIKSLLVHNTLLTDWVRSGQSGNI